VEPTAAKQFLPTLGSSAVWLTCLVFFQVTLLRGYLYAHWLTRCRASDWRQHLYIATLSAAVLLLVAQRIFPATLSPGSDPVTTIFATLANTIGPGAVWSIVEQSSKHIGVEHFGAHDLRRTCAPNCAGRTMAISNRSSSRGGAIEAGGR
jgi:hypothetical protein